MSLQPLGMREGRKGTLKAGCEGKKRKGRVDGGLRGSGRKRKGVRETKMIMGRRD